jgi:hypothetical protein
MRLANRLTWILTVSSTLALLACGGGDDAGDDDDGGGVDPAGTHYQFVANEISVPTSAAEVMTFALDIAGNEQADNQLGNLLNTLNGLGLDVSTTVDANVQNGNVIILADIQATSLDAATGVGMSFYLGENPTPAACTDPELPETCGNHLDGSGSFSVSASSPDNALLVGAIVGGSFSGGPGNVTLELPLAAGTDPIVLDLIGAKAEVAVTADGLMSGKLGGAITDADIRTEVLPAVVTVLADLVADDCTGTAPECCPGDESDSAAAQVLGILDDNMDCVVTLAELEADPIIASTLLNPDLDMLDGTEIGPDTDGTKDSLSIGVGFSAVAATFTP